MDKGACNSVHYQYNGQNSNMVSSVTMHIIGYIILMHNREWVDTLSSRVNKRGEYLMLYRPVIDDCAEVKWLPFRVTYRLLVFVRFLTAISLATP